MATLESWMPHDLEIANRYLNQARTLRGILADGGSASVVALADRLTRATVHFGRCELLMHRVDRNAALNTNAALVSTETKRAMAYQARGLQELTGVELELSRLLEEMSALDEQATRTGWEKLEPELKASWLEALGDLDMKPSDAEKLRVVFDDCCAAAAAGPKRIAEHLGKQFAELERLRKSSTRGTEDNWPYWKLVAVALWLGITVASLLLTLQRGARWWEIGMIVFISLCGILLIAFGC